MPALEKSYRMLEDVQSTSGRKINIIVNGVREQPAEGFVPYPQREREAAKA
jgi:polysaccharide biosynthesis transport protein